MTALSNIIDFCEYDHVTIRVKVLKVNDSQLVSTGKTKQDIDVVDLTGATTLTLWESDVGSLLPATSYQINRVHIHKFNGKTTLTYPSHGASFQEIEDLGITDHTYDLFIHMIYLKTRRMRK